MPTLAEGLTQAVRDRRESLALQQEDRRRRQIADRTGIAQTHLTRLYQLLGAEQVLHTAPPAVIVECSSDDSLEPHEYVVLRDDDIEVAVRLWPVIGAEHEENRPYLIGVCERCNVPLAVTVTPHETTAGWADAHMAPRHRATLGCDEPF